MHGCPGSGVGKAVSTTLNAFIEGMHILAAVLVASEAINALLKPGVVRTCILCKLDIEKAYDHIS